MPPRPASIKVRALQWLAQREHSRSELRDKLLRLMRSRSDGPPGSEAAPADATAPTGGEAAAEVETLLCWLEQRGYLSERRFVESRLRTRAARYGNLRIQHELQQHGLKLEPAAEQDLRQTELQRAHEVWRKKFGAPAADATGRIRQLRFLAGRGFSSEVVRRVVLDAGQPEASSSSGDEADTPA